MVHDRSACPVMRLLVDRTRRAAVCGPALADAHREVGKALAPFAARRMTLVDEPIDHVAGPSTGACVKDESAPIVLALMRAGLFVAEGLWATVPGASLVPWDGAVDGLSNVPVERRAVIIVDSVINTGRSMDGALQAVYEGKPAWVSVAALVANAAGLSERIDLWPEVEWAIARVSQRSYVGKGGTDTGARLFGTTGWE